MADPKNSHKGGRTRARNGTETEDGHTDKNKTRLKYTSSIPLQDHQSLVRSANLNLQKSGKGSSPRPRSRAMSETSDPLSENDVSLTGTQYKPDMTSHPEETSNNLNLHKRRAMEEEDGLDMTPQNMSRPSTPSQIAPPDGHEVNKTPRAKSRFQPLNMTHHLDTIEIDTTDMENDQDDLTSNEEEATYCRIRWKMEDTLYELASVKETPLWVKLDFIEQWTAQVLDLTGSLKVESMDKHIITNLAETNAYLTKKIVELELKDIGFKPETIQPAAAAPKASAPTPSQSTWAQVTANAHQKTPTPTQPI